MPYCSIDEAWGQGFLSNKNQPKKFKKIVPEFIPPNKLGYSSIDYSNSKNINIFSKNKKCKTKRKRSFSRTYNKLPEHSGVKSRLPTNNIIKKISFKNKKNKKNKYYKNKKNNIDKSINNYDDNYIEDESDNESESESESEDELDSNINEKFTNNSDYINNILNENRKLRNIIERFESKKNETDSIFDLVIFISTGIFIIFLLDMISKGIRKF